MAHNEHLLRNGERLFAGSFLRSENGLFYALMQEDGNFVVYRGDLFKTKPPGYDKTALWSVWPVGNAPGGGTGYHIFMQTDGNLCIYRQNPHAVPWCCPQTMNNRKADGRFLELRDDGKLDIHNIWDSGKGDSYDEVEFDKIDYILDPAPKITSLGSPGVSLSQVATNGTSTDQTATLSVTYNKTTSTGWKSATTLKIGASAKVKTGIPFIAEGEVTTSTELSESVEFNKSETKSEAVTVALPVKVPPGKSVVAKCTWKQSKLNIPFVAVGKIKFRGYPDLLPVTMDGVYDGVTTHDIQTWWKEVPSPTQDGAGLRLEHAPGAAAAAVDEDGWHLIERLVSQS